MPVSRDIFNAEMHLQRVVEAWALHRWIKEAVYLPLTVDTYSSLLAKRDPNFKHSRLKTCPY